MIPVTIGDFESFSPRTIYALGAIDLFAAARLPKDPANPARPARIPPVLGEFRVLVTDRVSAPRTTYDPPLEFTASTNPGGFILLTGDAKRSDSSDPPYPLAAGRYRWRVESDFYQVYQFEDDWPPAEVYDQAKDLRLQPGPGYPFPDLTLKQREFALTLVRGSFFTASGAPAVGASVELIAPVLPANFAAFAKCAADDQGDWVLVFIELQQEDPAPDFAHSRVRFTFGANQNDIPLAIVAGTENVIRQTALRGRVVDSSGRGLQRARISTSLGGAESLSQTDGRWSLYFPVTQGNAQVQVTATAPNGSSASQNVEIQQGKTLVLPTMKIA